MCWRDLHFLHDICSKSTYTNAWIQYNNMQFHTCCIVKYLQYYNVSTLAFKSSIVESCKSMLLFCGIFAVLSGSSVNESITEAYVARCVRCWGVLCSGHFLIGWWAWCVCVFSLSPHCWRTGDLLPLDSQLHPQTRFCCGMLPAWRREEE